MKSTIHKRVEEAIGEEISKQDLIYIATVVMSDAGFSGKEIIERTLGASVVKQIASILHDEFNKES